MCARSGRAGTRRRSRAGRIGSDQLGALEREGRVLDVVVREASVGRPTNVRAGGVAVSGAGRFERDRRGGVRRGAAVPSGEL